MRDYLLIIFRSLLRFSLFEKGSSKELRHDPKKTLSSSFVQDMEDKFLDQFLKGEDGTELLNFSVQKASAQANRQSLQSSSNNKSQSLQLLEKTVIAVLLKHLNMSSVSILDATS